MKKVDSSMDLPKVEEGVLKFWDENKIFEKSIKNREGCPEYSFYDGPPFATGTPHNGHIVASTMKDVVPRFWAMKGKKVERKWGWDCHGLPIENIAEKALGITSKKQIEEIGVEKFNDACRSKVLEYVGEWKSVIHRLGRWADMENSYKTMDLSYMESVWWTFKQLWDKGLIYEGYRSMHICPRCETTLSQSEVAEGYKDIKDLSVIAKFELLDGPSTGSGQARTYILAWTTTPWTLLGNVALAVGSKVKYVTIEKKDEESGKLVRFILAKDRVKEVFKEDQFSVVNESDGDSLVGKKYAPIFDHTEDIPNIENGWQVVTADFVTTEEGTGVVHIAPAFGEDDMNLGKEKDLPFIQHIGMDGIIKPGYGDLSGLNVKPAEDVQKTDVEIIKYLAAKGLLFFKEKYEHSYPHCWRCDTPLLNYATSSWFVSVEKIKDKALELAKDINWSPNHVKSGRFGKWLEGARDWSISRQRYWASCMPIWKCECGEIKVVGSVKELEDLSGEKIVDIHKHVVDNVTFKCEKCNGEMKRVPDVLDTWFDSGSMPYAQNHYPFEGKEKFESTFPAEFIAEGVDQTRAWFYYLHVISTAIFEKPAYKNVIVNGIVLAEDGKKMSKRLQNYPDPMEMFHKYGADVVRYYLMSSPVVAAENMNFAEKELNEISRGLFRMLWNSYSFFVLYADIDGYQGSPSKEFASENILDKWIVSELEMLVEEVDGSMEKYNLLKATRSFQGFVDNLSNWYIRRSRKRFWKSENDDDKNNAYDTLYYILIKLSKLMAPFAPFISEEIFKNLTDEESVHLTDFPHTEKELIDKKLNNAMQDVRKIVEIGLSARSENGIKVRQPLAGIKYSGSKLNDALEEIIAEEVNIKQVDFAGESDKISVQLDTVISEELKQEGSAREIIRQLQVMRKKAGFEVSDRIKMRYGSDSSYLNDVVSRYKESIAKEILAIDIQEGRTEIEYSEEFSVEKENIWLGISKEVNV